jgi:thioredoxin-related protein
MKSARHALPALLLAFAALLISACGRQTDSAATGPAVRAHWLTDFAAAQTQAKTENKLVLLDFTGSDWCPWCIKMDQETLDTQPFKDYADANLVLVELDFPEHKKLSDAVTQQNHALYDRFNCQGYPTFVVLGPDGSTLNTFVGYQEGGPDAFIAQLKKLAPKS